MKKTFGSQAENFLKSRKRKEYLRRGIAFLSAFVMLFTMNTLKRNADTLERIPMCHLEEHVHTLDCYDAEGALICGLEEHVHTDACYQERPVSEAAEMSLEEAGEELEFEIGGEEPEANAESADVEPEAAAIEAEEPAYPLGQAALLSEIIAALEVPVQLDEIEAVGPVENEEAQAGLLLAELLEGGDYQITALKAFDEAELAIVTKADILTVKLIDGAVEEAQEAEIVTEEAPVAEEQTEAKEAEIVTEEAPVAEEQAEAQEAEVVTEEAPAAEEQAEAQEAEVVTEEAPAAEEQAEAQEAEVVTEEAPVVEAEAVFEAAPAEVEVALDEADEKRAEAPAAEKAAEATAEPVTEELNLSASVSVDLSSVDLMEAATIEGDTVSLSVAKLLSAADETVSVEGDLDVDHEEFAAAATVVSGDVDVRDGAITLTADALESGSVSLELQTEATEDEVTTVTTQTVDIELTGYTGRTTEEIGGDANVQVVPVEGNSLPADATASINETAVPEGIVGEAEVENVLEDAKAFDITITNDNGDEISETGAVAVTVTPENMNVLADLPEGAAAGEITYTLYHVHDDGTYEPVKDAEFDVAEDGTVNSFSFTTDSFSTYVVKYTVDFTYVDEAGEEHFWQFPGTGSRKLSEVLDELGIQGAIEKADLTRTETVGEYGEKDLYLTQDAETGEYTIHSDVAFDDTYALTVTVDGVEYVVTVTDLTFGTHVITINNNTGNALTFNLWHVVLDQTYEYNVHYSMPELGSFTASGNGSTKEIIIDTLDGTNKYNTGNNSTNVYFLKETPNGYNYYSYESVVGKNSNEKQGSLEGVAYTITTIGDATTIDFGDPASTTYNAAIEFKDASGTTVSSPSLTGSYSLVAKVGSDIYHAHISGSTNKVEFLNASGTQVANDFDLTNAATFKIVSDTGVDWTSFDYASATSVSAIGGYTNITIPTSASSGKYTITVAEPRNCTVGVTFKDTSNNDQSTPNLDSAYYYYVVAVKGGSPVGYAPFTGKADSLTFTGEAPDDSSATTLWVVRSENAITNVSQINGLTDKVTTSGGLLGSYAFEWSNEPSGTTYTVTGKEKAFWTVSLEFYDSNGTTPLSPDGIAVGSGFYVLVMKDSWGNYQFYAPVNVDGTLGQFINSSGLVVPAPEGVNAVQLVRYTGEASSMTLSELVGHNSIIYADNDFGDDYTCMETTKVDAERSVTIKAKLKEKTYAIQLSFDPQNPTLDGKYYLLAKESGDYKYYVPVESYGFDTNSKKDVNGQSANDLKSAHGFSFELVKWTSASDPSNISDLSSLSKITSIGGTVSDEAVSYRVTMPESASMVNSNPTYLFTAEAAATYTASINFYDEWSSQPNNSLNLSGYTLKASDGTTNYTASITNSGALTFSGELPSGTLTWKLNDADIVSGTTTIGSYVLTGPTLSGKEYVFEARQPNTYGVRIDFYDAWSDTAKGSQTLGSGYTLEAVGDATYTATLTGNGAVAFDTSVTKVPQIDSWTFKKDNETTHDLDGYVVSDTPTVDSATHTYVFEARQPNTYTASLTFKKANGDTETPSSLASGYYLVVNDAIYAPVTASGLGTWVGVTGDALPQINSFKFVQNTGTVSGIDDVKDLSAVSKLGDYDILTTTATADGNHNYAFEAKLPTVCTASITLTGDAPASGDYYYVVARKNNANIGYARFTGAGAGALSFTDGTNTVALDDSTTFWIVKSQSDLGDLSGIDSLSDKVTATGGELGDYVFTWPSSPTNDAYVITATRQQLYGLTINFDPSASVTMDDGYYFLLVKCNNSYKYYAQLTAEGFANLKNAAGATVTGITQASGFEIVKTGDANATFSTLQSMPKITSGGTIGEYYTVTIPESPTETNYVFNAVKQAHDVSIQFKDSEGKDARVTPDNYYYLVAKVDGQRKYFAPVTGNAATLTFKDAAGDPHISDLPDATFELVKSDSEVDSLANLHTATVSVFTAGAVEYGLGVAELNGTTYTLTPTEMSGYRILFNFLDKDGSTVVSPSVPTGYFVVFLAKVDNQDKYYYAAINADGTVGTIYDSDKNAVSEVPEPKDFRILNGNADQNIMNNPASQWNCNDDKRVKDGGTLGEYEITYPSVSSVPSDGKYIFTARKPIAYVVEIRMLNAKGELEKPAAQLGGNYQLIGVLIDDNAKYAVSYSNNMNPGDYASKLFMFKSFGDSHPYTVDANVEAYFGPDISWNGENQTISNSNKAIKEGTVIGDYWFEVVKETGRTTYIGHPLTPHTVNVQFDAAPGTTYQIYAEEEKNGKLYTKTSEPLAFNDSHFATTSITSLSRDNVGTIAVSENTRYYIQKNGSQKFGNGGVDGEKAFTITTDSASNTTTITRDAPGAYPYTVKVVKNDGTTGTGAKPYLHDTEESWYVYAAVTRPDGTYSFVAPLVPSDFETTAPEDTLTGTIPYFFREADSNNTGSAAKTAYLPGEHVSFALLRPAGDVTNPAWAYYADTSHINYNGMDGSAIEGLYTLKVEEDTTSGSTTLKLVTGPEASVTFAAHSGATKETAIEVPADLNNPGVGKYFIFARLFAPDGVKRRTGFYVAELPTALPESNRSTYAITNGFSVNRAQANEAVNKSKYLVTGDRIFDTGLVYTTNASMTATEMLEQLNQYEVSNQIRTDNYTSESAGTTKPYTLITHSQTAGGYRLISAEGSRANPEGSLDLVKLPRLTVSAEVRQANGAVAKRTQDSANHYYVLAELIHGGVKSYAYRPIDTASNESGMTTAASTLNAFTATSGMKYYYETGDTINYYVVKSASAIESVSAAAAAPRYAEGQLMGNYVPSFEKDGNNVIAVLTEGTAPTGVAQTVSVQLLDYNKTTQLTGSKDNRIPLTTEVYSVLSYLTPKGTGAKGQVVGWNVQRIYATSNDESTFASASQKPAVLNIEGKTSVTIPENGFKICDANMEPVTYVDGNSETQTAMMGYDPELYDLNVRLFHGSEEMTSYNDRYEETYSGSNVMKFSDDAPSGYDFMDAAQSGTETTIRLHNAYTKEYKLKLRINQIDEQGIDFQANENYWVMVQLNHKSGEPTFAFAQLAGVSSNAAGETEFELTLNQSGDNYWYAQGHGSPSMLMTHFTGNEESVTFEIIKSASETPSYGNMSSHTADGSNHIKVGESTKLYTLVGSEREQEENISAHKVTITDTIILTEDVNGIKKGEIDTIIEQAREFGLYTEILSKHATDMEANIGAARVTGPIGADYGFSSRNTMVNRLKVVKQYLGADGKPVNKSVTLGLFDALTGDKIGEITKTTGADSMPNGVAEFEFEELPAGQYILKEKLGDTWYSYEDVSDPIPYDGGNMTVNFADGVITMRDINSNVNYFGTIESGNLTDLLRHSRQGTVVTDNNYAALVAADPSGSLATVYQTGSEQYPKTYDIPADMERLRALSVKLADSTSSKTVRVMNYKLGDIPQNGIEITGDGRYVVLNIDVTGYGSHVDVFTRVHYDGHQLDPDFGGSGKEDASKVLWNFYTRDANGAAHPYSGHIDTACEGSGVLLAPDAVVGDLGGNWGGTIICHEAQHAGSEIHSENPNKIINTNTMLTNSLSSTKLGNLTLQKAITGETRDRTTWFTFEVTLTNADGTNPMAGKDIDERTFLASGLRDDKKTVIFDTNGKATVEVRAENQVTISGLPDGLLYHVDEKETEESEFYQLVQIENGDGFVTSDGVIKGGKTVLAKAINAHKVGGLTVSKTVAGISTTQEFEFRVTIMAEDSNDQPATDINGMHGGMNFTNGVATFHLGNGQSKTIEAAEIPTGRKFKVEEIDANKTLNGVQFLTDVTVKTTGGVTCNVENNVVTGTISDDKNAIIVAYTNTHTNGTTYRPQVTKNLVMNSAAVADAKWPSEGFTFTLAAATNNPAGATLTGTSATATAAKKTASFGAIQFDYNEAPWERTYNFTITEKAGSAPGVTYNTDPLTLQIVVNKDNNTADPKLVITSVKYGTAAAASGDAIDTASGTIANNYDEVVGRAAGDKKLTGRDWKEGETFLFTLTPDIFTLNKIGKSVELPKPGPSSAFTVDDETKAITISASKPASGNTQSFTFPDIAFKEPGTYAFLMEEVGKGATKDGTDYSGKTVKATFTVTRDNTTHKLAVVGPVYTVVSGASGAYETAADNENKFENTYTSTDTFFTPSVTKNLTQNDAAVANALWPADGFKFKLEVDPTNPAGATVPTNRHTVATAAERTASFEEIKFTKVAGENVHYPLTYNFIISEVEPEGTVDHVKDDITYSTDKLYLSVVVALDANQRLSIESATYKLGNPDDGEETDVITNTIPDEGPTTLTGTKAWLTNKVHGVPTLKLTRGIGTLVETAVLDNDKLVWQLDPQGQVEYYQPTWNGNTYTYAELDKRDGNGLLYTYVVSEISFTVTVDETTYTYTVAADGTVTSSPANAPTFRATHDENGNFVNAELIAITGEKVWHNESGAAFTPADVFVTLNLQQYSRRADNSTATWTETAVSHAVTITVSNDGTAYTRRVDGGEAETIGFTAAPGDAGYADAYNAAMRYTWHSLPSVSDDGASVYSYRVTESAFTSGYHQAGSDHSEHLTATATQTINNFKLSTVALPHTGGVGATLFTVGGGSLLLLAVLGWLLLAKKRDYEA